MKAKLNNQSKISAFVDDMIQYTKDEIYTNAVEMPSLENASRMSCCIDSFYYADIYYFLHSLKSEINKNGQ